MAGRDETHTVRVAGDHDIPGDDRQQLLLIFHSSGVHAARLEPARAVVIGRKPPSNLVFADNTLSREHVRFELQDDAVWVEDLDSTNGTFMNGERIERARLTLADEVRAGSLIVLLRGMRDPDSREPFGNLGLAELPSALSSGTEMRDEEAELIAVCPSMRELERMVDRLAGTTIPVLIAGEVGSGKKLIARAIHQRGERWSCTMRSLTCGMLPEHLIERVLFGFESKGSDDDPPAAGVFETAAGGTVLLDEISALSMSAQLALLRLIESRKVTRVGAANEIDADVRIIATTQQDLLALCEQGSFNTDLYYRLNTMMLTIPPLREHPEDIEPLAEHFASRICAAEGRPAISFDEEALKILRQHSWPGNVRELQTVIERIAILSEKETIGLDDLPSNLLAPRDMERAVHHETLRGAAAGPPADAIVDLKARLRTFEIGLIRSVLRRTDGKRMQAAQLLGITSRTLLNKMNAYGIDSWKGADDLPGNLEQTDLKELVSRHEAFLIAQALEQAGGNHTEAARQLGIATYTLAARMAKHGLT